MGFLKGLLICGLVSFSFIVNAQRYARANGAWSAAIWAATPGGVAGTAATPTATDDVYTNGFLVSVGANATCRNLFITYNLANSLSIAVLRTLTVTGTLNGWDDAGVIEQIPTASVLSFGGGSTMIFTAVNIQPAYDPYVIFFWDNTVPLGRVTFNFGGLSKNIIIPLSISSIARLQSGTLTADPGSSLTGNSTATFQVDAGATFSTNDPLANFNVYSIGGILQTSSTISATGGAGSITVNSGGILNSTGTSGAISSSTTTISGTVNTSNSLTTSGTFQINSTGVLNTSFIGVNQTEGWWSLTNRPSSSIIDVASTINYSGTSQNVYTLSYGNLTLSGSGAKTSAGAGSINVAGNLSISAGVTLNNSQSSIFNGTTAQNISGGGTANFNGGLQVNKTGTLTLSQSVNVLNGLTLTAGTIDFGSNTVNLSGNLSNSATLVASSSTLNITGTTSITGSTTSLNNLTISGTGNFTAPSALNIAGNFTNNGTFNASTGNVTFNGLAAQSIAGSSTSTFYDITTSNSISVSSPTNLSGILTINSGTFTTGGFLTLLSSASGDAMIGPVSGTLSGNVTVQRYLPNGTSVRAYRYLASPVVGATVAAWKASFPITGTFTDPSTQAEWPAISGIVQASPSMYFYNEPLGGAFTARYATYPLNGNSTSSSSLVNGTGYSAYIRQTAPIILSVTGTVRTGNNVTVPVTNLAGNATDDGWNLIGNPFPAPINWSSVTLPAGLMDAIYLKDNTGNLAAAGSYVTYVGGVGSPGSYTGVIPSGEAFFVRYTTAGSTNIVFKEADKITSRNPTFLRVETIVNILRARLMVNGRQDELVIRLVDGAKDEVDNNFDAYKLTNDYLNFSSLSSDGKKLSINSALSLNVKSPLKKFPLVIAGNGNFQPSGNATINFSEFETFVSGVDIYLKDAFVGDSVKIESNSSVYSFSITSDPKSYQNRFTLSIGRANIVTSTQDEVPNNLISVYPNPSEGIFTVQLSKKFEKTVKAINSIGKEVGQIELTSEGDLLKGQFDLTSQASGLYFIQISDGNKLYTKKVIKK